MLVFFISHQVMGDIKFAVCLSVCSPETAEQIWQKFCREPEVCPGHCVGHLLAIAPGARGPTRGAKKCTVG